MKYVILSADGDSNVYSVPDVIADHLEEYCMEFCNDWLYSSPYAKKYRTKEGVCYNEADFIDYLNRFVFPGEKSVWIKTLGWTQLGKKLPNEYQDYPYFNF